MNNPNGHLWKDEYKIGNKTIDAQHYQLFYNIEKLVYICRTSGYEDKRQECKRIIEFLLAYTTEHFSCEEEYQRETGYVSLELHKKIHDSFTNTVIQYQKKLEEADYCDETVKHFTGTLLTWLVVHVLGCDMKIPRNDPIASSLVFGSAEKCIKSVVQTILGNMYGFDIQSADTCMYKGFIEGDIFIETKAHGPRDYLIVYGVSKKLAVAIFKRMSGIDLSNLDTPDEMSESAFLELAGIFSTYILSGLSNENGLNFSMEHNIYVKTYPSVGNGSNNLLLDISTDAGDAEIMIRYQK